MSEISTEQPVREREFRHRGRGSQIPIYLGKQFRFFVNESDWKVIPMAAVIAALVAMVIKKKLFINMEGTLMSAFAVACVAIWNGCFNSIQAVCRERQIIKREHRSGMHISSYVIAHMIYQLVLCLVQTGVSVYVMKLSGVQFPEKGFMTPWMMVDLGISMFLITYASDMMSLFISSVSHTTTGAMTVMPFVLIFQLVFSGGIIPLPEWCQPISNFTISNYGLRVITAQCGYNELPMVTAWNTLSGMRDTEVGGDYTVEELMALLDSKAVTRHREDTVIPSVTVNQAAALLGLGSTAEELRQELTEKLGGETAEKVGQEVLNEPVTLGQVLDLIRGSDFVQKRKDTVVPLKTTVGDMLDLFGEEKVKDFVQTRTAAAAYKPQYDRTVENIVHNWLMLGVFVLAFAALATLSLELIDRDKR